MPTYVVRLVSLALFAILCAVTTYWVILLLGRGQVVTVAAEPYTPPESRAAAELFGGKPGTSARQEFKVVGILSLGPGQGAAAILTAADGPAHTWSAGQKLDGDTKVAEIRERSVVLERSGIRTEIFIPAATQSSGYVR